MLTALSLLACGPEEPATMAVEPEPEPEWIDPWEPIDVAYDRSATESSLQVAIDTVIDLRATPVIEIYDTIMSMASPMCPTMQYDFEGYSAWVDSCATVGGTQYSGYAYTEAATVDSVTYETIALSATVSSQTTAFSGSGYWAETSFSEDGVSFWGTYLEGQVLWDGPGPDNWITRGIRPSVEIERSQFGELPFTFVNLRGAVGELDAIMPTAEFIDVSMEEVSCSEPVGTISVRDVDGNWFDVSFDGETCDGCGTASHLGEELGEACVSFDSWISWEPQP